MTAAVKVRYPKVRRIAFPFGQPKPMEKYFVWDSIVFSHLLSIFSYSFPTGEEFFVRSVRRFSNEITDPVLKKRVAAFVGQETVHGEQHNVLNDKLIELGYSNAVHQVCLTAGKLAEKVEAFTDERFPAKRWFPGVRTIRLALLGATAAGEHFTAVGAERILGRDDVQEMFTDPEVKNLMSWHAFEELEHKSVAFDVYRAVGGPEWLRIAIMRSWGVIAYPLFSMAVLFSIFTSDRSALRHPARLARETHQLFTSPLVTDLIKAFKPYYQRGFHPDDIDTTAMLDKWGAKLFGETGTLVSHLK